MLVEDAVQFVQPLQLNRQGPPIPRTFSRPTIQGPPTPEVLERRRAQLRVARRVLDASVAEPILNAPRVVAGIGQGIAAGMAQHVGMDGEGKTGAHADALDQAVDGVGRERPAAFGGEDEGRVRALPAQLT
jgi:hypothetical protein